MDRQTNTNKDCILEVRGLKTYFHTEEGIVRSVDGVSFSVKRGKTLGIVGESGCGKSVTSLSVMGLVKCPPGRIESGEILLDGEDLLKKNDEEMRLIRGKRIAMIFQEPMTSLNPVFTVGQQITEALRIHEKISKEEAKERAIDMLRMVKIPLPEQRFREYPHQLSGGMRQRVIIAMALCCKPDLLICDEPTTALDVTIQAQILELINNLKKQRNLSVIFITHDLGVVANMADRIAVMYAGQIVEYGTAKDVFYEPAHPYTWALLASVPDLDTKEKLESIPGTPPNMIYPPKGDAFAERNANALEIDFEMQPPMFQISDTHYAATWLLDPRAPKIEMPKVILERLARIQARNAAKKAEMTKEEG